MAESESRKDNGGDGSKELTAAISEVREWLVRIETHQSNQTQLLTEIKDSADKANEKADTADDKAERALSELNTYKGEVDRRFGESDRRFEENDKKWSDDRVEKRWVWGLLFTGFFYAWSVVAHDFYKLEDGHPRPTDGKEGERGAVL